MERFEDGEEGGVCEVVVEAGGGVDVLTAVSVPVWKVDEDGEEDEPGWERDEDIEDSNEVLGVAALGRCETMSPVLSRKTPSPVSQQFGNPLQQ